MNDVTPLLDETLGTGVPQNTLPSAEEPRSYFRNYLPDQLTHVLTGASLPHKAKSAIGSIYGFTFEKYVSERDHDFLVQLLTDAGNLCSAADLLCREQQIFNMVQAIQPEQQLRRFPISVICADAKPPSVAPHRQAIVLNLHYFLNQVRHGKMSKDSTSPVYVGNAIVQYAVSSGVRCFLSQIHGPNNEGSIFRDIWDEVVAEYTAFGNLPDEASANKRESARDVEEDVWCMALLDWNEALSVEQKQRLLQLHIETNPFIYRNEKEILRAGLAHKADLETMFKEMLKRKNRMVLVGRRFLHEQLQEQGHDLPSIVTAGHLDLIKWLLGVAFQKGWRDPLARQYQQTHLV